MSRSAVDWGTSRKANYIAFRKKYPEVDITYDEWKNVIYSFMDLFKESILETGYKMRLPSGLGEFSISKGKKKKFKIENDGKQYINLSIDWQKSKEKNKHIYNFNYHTEGYNFWWKWFKKSSNFKLKNYWYFRPCRGTSRLLAHYLKVDEKYHHLS